MMAKFEKANFPNPSMVAEGESSVPFSGKDVVAGYRPPTAFSRMGCELEPCHWGNTGVGGMETPIEGAPDQKYGPIGLAMIAARRK